MHLWFREASSTADNQYDCQQLDEMSGAGISFVMIQVPSFSNRTEVLIARGGGGGDCQQLDEISSAEDL